VRDPGDVGKRFIAVVIVLASACTALHYSTTQQHAVTIANNPYHFPGPGSQVFVVSPQGSGDHNVLDAIYLMNCSSQWMLSTSIDSQQPVMGANVCGFGTGSGSGSTLFTADIALACPRNYQFGVGYAGTLPGVDACAVIITSVPYGGSGYETYTLNLTGSGSGVTGIAVSPKEIIFGGIPISTSSSPETITVTNKGSASVTVTGVLTGSVFQVSPNPSTPISVGPGSSQDYTVTCMPLAVTSYSGDVTFNGGGSSGSTTLSCDGISSTVTIAPTQITFANTLVGRPPPNKTVMLTGTPTATIEDVSLDAAAMAEGVTIVQNPEGMLLGSGQTIVLAYSAAAMHESGPLGVMSVKVSTDTSARPVSISGQALLGGLGTNPASVELGAVCIGGSSTKSIEVYANEPGDIVLQQLTKPAAPFDAMAVDTLPKVLAGNHSGPSATVRATLTPTMPGEFTDAIALTSDVPGKPMTEVTLHGIGLAAGIAATPDVVHFGAAAPGSTTSIKEVQLTNCGTGDLMFTGATISGAQAGEFTLIGANPPRTLMPTESEVFMVVMQPDSGGFKMAQLLIQHSAGSTAVDLDGTGDGTATDDKERETYYACSTGRGAALWPIALALLALRRRRR
jgi:hypothetical protein